MQERTESERKMESDAQEADRQRIHAYNRNLKKSYVRRLIIVLLATFAGYLLVLTAWNPMGSMEKIVFHDYESFVSYMEKDVPNPYGEQKTEVKTETIEDVYGNVVCEYEERNQAFFSITFTYENGVDPLPIEVSTREHLKKAQGKAERLRHLFALAFSAEIVAAIVLYNKKREFLR